MSPEIDIGFKTRQRVFGLLVAMPWMANPSNVSRLASNLKVGTLGRGTARERIGVLLDRLEELADGWDRLLAEVEAEPVRGGIPQGNRLDDLRGFLRLVTYDPATQEAISDVRKFWDAVSVPEVYFVAYWRTVERAGPVIPDTIQSCVDTILGDRLQSHHNLVLFLERVAFLLDVEGRGHDALEFRKLVDRLALCLSMDQRRFRYQRDMVASESSDVRHHVLIRLEDGEMQGWHYWSVRSGQGSVELNRTVNKIATEAGPFDNDDEICRALGRMLGKVSGLATSVRPEHRPIVQIMLPWDRLNTRVEQWQVNLPVNGAGRSALGQLAPVVVRPHHNPTEADLDVLLRRWDQAHAGQPVQVLQIGSLDQEIGGEDWSCLAIKYHASDPDAKVRAARSAGIPVAIWSRDGSDPLRAVNGGGPRHWPQQLYNRRCGADSCDVALVYDDPHWVPDGPLLEWRGL
ncbi:MAG TPA: hypothetical protein VLJ59_03665 [Mycobacteriales bacterium]|nr:hypothetical protein [Mycobacteriales bacterium]